MDTLEFSDVRDRSAKRQTPQPQSGVITNRHRYVIPAADWRTTLLVALGAPLFLGLRGASQVLTHIPVGFINFCFLVVLVVLVAVHVRWLSEIDTTVQFINSTMGSIT